MMNDNGTFIGLVKAGKAQNVVHTSRKMNMAAALAGAVSLRDAEQYFRRLQHANNMGTTEADYAELERKFYAEHGYPYGY